MCGFSLQIFITAFSNTHTSESINLGYKISRGSGNPQFVEYDIAIIKVDDTGLPMHHLKSACLPTPNKNAANGVHAGWSQPPSIEFVQSSASGYTNYYR